MSQVNTRKSVIFLKAGAVLPVPPADYIETTEEVIVTPIFSEIGLNRLTGNMNDSTSAIDTCKTSTAFNIKHEMRATGSTFDKPPEYGELLKIGGFKEVISAGVSVKYVNELDLIPNGSAVYFMDGNKSTMKDSLVADLTFDFKIGSPALIDGKITGFIDSAESTKEANPTVVKSSESLLMVSCMDVITIGGVKIPVEEATIKVNPTIQEIYTMGGVAGIKKNFITDYALELSITFFVDQATINREASAIEAGTFETVEILLGVDRTSGAVNGETVKFSASLSKAVIYSDKKSKDMLSRTVTYRLMNDPAKNNVALSILHGTIV